jgi:hypothetical protein
MDKFEKARRSRGEFGFEIIEADPEGVEGVASTRLELECTGSTGSDCLH